MKRASLAVITPGLLGFLGMAALGWYLANPSLTKTETGVTESIAREQKRPLKSPRDHGIVAAQMRAVRDAGSPVERLRSAIALANSLPPSEFAAWMEGDRFDFRKGPELSVFRMIVFERWIKESPESLIPWAGENNHGQAGRALLYLANNNPQSLIDHYRSHPDDRTELLTLKEVAKKHPALALQRLQELSARGIPAESAWKAAGALEELAGNSPAALEAALGTLDPEFRRKAESLLCGQRLAASFPTELAALCERPDGWQIFSDNASRNGELATKLIAEIAGLPQSWKAYMAMHTFSFISEKNGKEWFNADLEGAGFSESQAKRIRAEALDEAASSDYEFALRTVAGAGLESHATATVIATAINTAKVDRSEVGRLIGMIGSEEGRRIARDQLELADQGTRAEHAGNPAEWLEKTGANDRSSGNLKQLTTWDKAQLAELRTRFNALPAAQQQNIASLVAADRTDSEIDPGFAGDAIRALVNHQSVISPANDNGVVASSTYAVRLSMSDPAAATSWINTLPEGEAKLWARKNVAANWQQYDPKAVNQWLTTLPADARNQVTEHLGKQK